MNDDQPKATPYAEAIVMERQVHVVLSARDFADAFVGGRDDRQRAILKAMVDDIRNWDDRQSWPMQCRLIAALTPEEKK